MKTTLLTGLAAILFAGTLAAQPKVGGLALDDPPQYYGNCNAMRVHFNGRINATGPMDVTYQWVRSDNARTPRQVLHFVRSGPLTVNFDWTVRGKSSGWVALKILSPQQLQSRQVGFATNCP